MNKKGYAILHTLISILSCLGIIEMDLDNYVA
jgi:hypothetical protein